MINWSCTYLNPWRKRRPKRPPPIKNWHANRTASISDLLAPQIAWCLALIGSLIVLGLILCIIVCLSLRFKHKKSSKKSVKKASYKEEQPLVENTGSDMSVQQVFLLRQNTHQSAQPGYRTSEQVPTMPTQARLFIECRNIPRQYRYQRYPSRMDLYQHPQRDQYIYRGINFAP